MKPNLKHIALLLLLSVPLLPGCSDTVVPVLGTERAFSLYGVLSPRADTQWVWVFPLTDRLAPDADAPLDAVFTSTDLQTGAERVWRDSLFHEASGLATHVFYLPERVDYDHTYRLRVERSDGAASAAVVAVPPDAALEQQAFSPPSWLPVLVRTAATRLNRVVLIYDVRYAPATGEQGTLRIGLPYDRRVTQVDDGWMVWIHLARDFGDIAGILDNTGRLTEYGVSVREMTLDLIVANDEWVAPDSVFDANVLVQPGTMTNVENGYGFVGAGFRLQLRWLPPSDILARGGFRP